MIRMNDHTSVRAFLKMLIPMNRVVFTPGVAVIAATQIIPEGIDAAMELAGIEEIAETHGTPLNEFLARVYSGDSNGDDIAEFAGRQCYRSWDKGRPLSEYIANVIDMAHGSVFQHSNIVMQITGISRALSHELVRHGTGTGFSQESQRYVDAKDMRFVLPPVTAEHVAGMSQEEMDADEEFTIFRRGCADSLRNYTDYQAAINARLGALKAAGDYKGATAYKKRANEAARALLGNAAETRMVFSGNLRALRYITSLRGTEEADLEIRRLACVMLPHLIPHAPEFFRGFNIEAGKDGLDVLTALNGRI